MSFRNNACRDRPWEGRKPLGQLLLEVRRLPREAQAFAVEPAHAPKLRAACGFRHALKTRLRGEDERAAAPGCRRRSRPASSPTSPMPRFWRLDATGWISPRAAW